MLIKSELIDSYIKEHKLTQYQFCELCKINIRTLNRVRRDDLTLDIRVLFRISKVLGIHIHELFNDIPLHELMHK